MTTSGEHNDGVIVHPEFNPETDKRPPSHSHDPIALQDADTLSLGRIPDSPAAHALTAKVAEAIRPHLGPRAAASINNTRDRGRQKRVDEVGYILGGIVRPGFKGKWLAVHESPSKWFWGARRELPVKHNAFWTKANAMREIGLLDFVPGQSFRNSWGDMSGNEARIRASDKLIEWAQECGCTLRSGTTDWKLVKPATIAQSTTPLVRLMGFPTRRNGTIISSTEDLPLPESLKDVEEFMQRLTTHLSGLHFSGCCQPVLSAKFIGSEHFHGRIYALCSDNYQNGISKDERQFIRINTFPVTEVDVSASFLSIALALLNAPKPEGDPYSLPGLDDALRPAIKHWFVVFFGKGKAVEKWPQGTKDDIKNAVDTCTIMDAVFQRYPALQNIQQIIPPEIAATVPQELQSWAIGQYLTNVEARIMRKAMTEHMDEGGSVLPLHDALMVPESEEGKAYHCLQRASMAILGRELSTNIF